MDKFAKLVLFVAAVMVAALLIPIGLDAMDSRDERQALSAAVDSHLARTEAHLEQRAFAEARQSLRAAEALAPRLPRIQKALQLAALLQLAAHPESLNAENVLALRDALQSLDAQIAESPRLLAAAGHLALAEGEITQAAARFQAALRQESQTPEAQLGVAALAIRSNNAQAAIAAFEAALSGYAGNRNAKRSLAMLYAHHNEPGKAEPLFRGLVGSVGSTEPVEVLLTYVKVLGVLEKPAEALQVLEIGKSRFSESLDILDALADAQEAAKQVPNAIDTLKKRVKLTWSPPQALRLGRLMVNEKRYKGALRVLTRLQADMPDDVDFLYWLGSAQVGQRRLKEAELSLARLVTNAGKNPAYSAKVAEAEKALETVRRAMLASKKRTPGAPPR